MPSPQRRLLMTLVLLAAVLAAASLTCEAADQGTEDIWRAWDPQGYERAQNDQLTDQMMEQSYREAVAEEEKQRQILSLTQTALSTMLTERAAKPPAPPPVSAHPPTILQVTFPTFVPANETHFIGTLKVTDAAHDVNWISIQIVQGNFPAGGFDPEDTLAWAGDVGSVPLEASCGEAQTVSGQVTVRDAAGNTSPPAGFTFTCQY